MTKLAFLTATVFLVACGNVDNNETTIELLNVVVSGEKVIIDGVEALTRDEICAALRGRPEAEVYLQGDRGASMQTLLMVATMAADRSYEGCQAPEDVDE